VLGSSFGLPEQEAEVSPPLLQRFVQGTKAGARSLLLSVWGGKSGSTYFCLVWDLFPRTRGVRFFTDFTGFWIVFRVFFLEWLAKLLCVEVLSVVFVACGESVIKRENLPQQ